tara:strand:+ start:2455 stop:2613 length:159 start_codon:yes stop_codon:yes gene_type:complete
MKKYKYYSLNDKNKETVGSCWAESINEAFYISSKMKGLSIDKFKKLFNVELM